MAHTFPVETYQKLDGIDFRILNEISFLSKRQQRRTGSAYCCPGREYLAGKVGCDVGTISRHTSKLVELGILDKRQRRPVRGQWQTCLYKLVSWAAWALASIAGQLRKLGSKPRAQSSGKPDAKMHRVRPDAHKVSCERNRNTPEGKNTVLSELTTQILKKWEQRGKQTS